MPFDGFVLAAIRKELEERVTGCFIDRIYQPSANSLVFNLRQAKGRIRLFLSAHPTNARAHLMQTPVENPASPPSFCMVLRKYLEGGRIKNIYQAGLDRILVLEIEAKDEIGAPAHRDLICEIMGKHSNIILVNHQTGQIVDAIKRYSHLVSRYREVLPGKPYLSPPAQDKRNPLLLSEEEFELTILSQPLELPLLDILQICLDGFSKTLAREVVYRADLTGKTILDKCGDYELKRLWQALQEIITPARNDQFEPTLVLNHKKYIDFAAFDLSHLTGLIHKKGEMNVLVDNFYAQKEASEEIEKQRLLLNKLVRKKIKHLEKKLALHQEKLDAAQEANKYRLYGELLMANLYRLEDGLVETLLENFYDPEHKLVCIPLYPDLSPVENALFYFKKYNRTKHALKKSAGFIVEMQKEHAYLASVETTLQQATSRTNLQEIKEELAEQGYLEKENKKKRKKLPRAPEILTFTSSDGFTILIGRNNKQNDYLIRHLARDNDLWLHVKNIPGAHVIIRVENRQPTPTALQEAASLAAYHSQARYAQNVPVDYTLRKNVHKPRDARPGFVVYKEQQTINVNPEEELLERLTRQKSEE